MPRLGQETEDRGWQLALGLIAVWRRTGDARKVLSRRHWPRRPNATRRRLNRP